MQIREESDAVKRVVVGMATCGIAAGARPVLNAFVDEVAFASDDTVTKVTIDGTDYDITPITQEIIDGRAY